MDSLTGEDPGHEHGYWVGGVMPSAVLTDAMLATNYGTRVVERQAIMARKLGHYIGAWRDSVTGTNYFDLSQWVPDLSDAMRIATERGELAIWDIRNGCELRTMHG